MQWSQAIPETTVSESKQETRESESKPNPFPSATPLFSSLSPGLREEQTEEVDRHVAPGFLEVMDLLRNLPEAIRSPLLLSKTTTSTATTTTTSQRGSKPAREEGKQDQWQEKKQEQKKQEQKKQDKQETRGAVYTIAGRTVVGVSGVPKGQGQTAGTSTLCRADEKKTAC